MFKRSLFKSTFDGLNHQSSSQWLGRLSFLYTLSVLLFIIINTRLTNAVADGDEQNGKAFVKHNTTLVNINLPSSANSHYLENWHDRLKFHINHGLVYFRIGEKLPPKPQCQLGIMERKGKKWEWRKKNTKQLQALGIIMESECSWRLWLVRIYTWTQEGKLTGTYSRLVRHHGYFSEILDLHGFLSNHKSMTDHIILFFCLSWNI